MKKTKRIQHLIIKSLVESKIKLNEYLLPQKNIIIGLVNQLVLATPSSSNPKGLEDKLNNILEFYRYYDSNWVIEDQIVFNEFKNKLLNLAKTYGVTLKQ
jgi:hypothetical protein